jgi:hypothetical protein
VLEFAVRASKQCFNGAKGFAIAVFDFVFGGLLGYGMAAMLIKVNSPQYVFYSTTGEPNSSTCPMGLGVPLTCKKVKSS